MAGTVCNLTSQGLTHGIDAGKDWLKRREAHQKEDTGNAKEAMVTEPSSAGDGQTTDMSGRPIQVGTAIRVRRNLLRWVPAFLGMVAVVLSISALLNEEPGPKVVTERIVTQPVVQERVIIEQHTVTVTVPVVVAAATSSAASNNDTTSTSTAAVGNATQSSTTQLTQTTTGIQPETTPVTAPPATEPIDSGPRKGTSDTDAN